MKPELYSLAYMLDKTPPVILSKLDSDWHPDDPASTPEPLYIFSKAYPGVQREKGFPNMLGLEFAVITTIVPPVSGELEGLEPSFFAPLGHTRLGTRKVPWWVEELCNAPKQQVIDSGPFVKAACWSLATLLCDRTVWRTADCGFGNDRIQAFRPHAEHLAKTFKLTHPLSKMDKKKEIIDHPEFF